jgi:DNA-binding XRE family transcriptional regulator/quercetin dioxygenase-like cupin family protein
MSSPLAGNLRRLRGAAGLSAVELARRAGLGRATLAQLEAGGGNPTLETLYALANELRVPLAELIAEPDGGAEPRVLRRGEGPASSGAVVDATLLHRGHRGGLGLEVYALGLRPGAVQRSAAHPPGTREHLHLHSGRVRVGPADRAVELAGGDYADYPADVEHHYECLDGTPASATLLILTPSSGAR